MESECLHRSKTDKPKLVIVNCSGGGLRAAMWTHFILQEVDERTQGSFMESTHLMTGASGGMIGAAYFRSIYASTSFEERLTKKKPISIIFPKIY